jgi:predicted dehydrogenase
MSVNDPIPVAVVGVGRMGKHHARVYRSLPQAHLLAVVDADLERGGMVAEEFGCEALPNVSELLARFPQVRAVTVAVPTVRHLAAAEPLLMRGVACLIEKPLAPTSVEARKLVELAAEHGVPLQVGHTERFNPAVRAVTAMSVTPRFMEVHRISPMTFRSLDVGVVMDMMIHDLDIVLSLANSPLEKVDAAGVAVLGEYEDVANARLVFANGCVANITASRLALKTERKLRLFSESAYVSLDYQKRTGILIRKSDNDQALSQIREQIRDGADLSSLDYSDLVSVDELRMDADDNADPLTAELKSFLDCVRDGGKPVVDGCAGVAAVEAAERVVAAIANHKWEGLVTWDA